MPMKEVKYAVYLHAFDDVVAQKSALRCETAQIRTFSVYNRISTPV